ncbi:MAG TPA: sialidase family protein [Candidatus Thermoplasmatota archaeon]|nr:sialidase family protein [Candidatus Thermoplasmatota archaeon]
MHAVAAPFLAMALLLSGCLQTAERPSTPDPVAPSPPGPLEPSYPEGPGEPPRPPVEPSAERTLVGIGGDAEASLAAGADGVMLVCSHGGFTKPSPLWASDDGGLTWREVHPAPNHPPSGDCDVAVAPDGTWYVAYATLASVTMAASTDRGQTWKVTYVSAVPVGGIVDRPWIVAREGDLLLSYIGGDAAGIFCRRIEALGVYSCANAHLSMVARSTDGGQTWAEYRVAMAPSGIPETCTTGRTFATGDGVVHLPLACWPSAGPSPPALRVGLLSSRDLQAWEFQQAHASSLGLFTVPTATQSPDGTFWLTWAEGSRAEGGVIAAASSDGASWSPPLVVASNRTSGGFLWPWIAAHDRGATLGWMDQTPHEGSPAWNVVVATIEADSRVQTRTTHYAEGDMVYEFSMVSLDAAGRAFLVHPLLGDGCKKSPPGMDDRRRNEQCIWLLRAA